MMVDTPLAVKKNCSYLYTSLLSFLAYKGMGIHVWNVNKSTSFFSRKEKLGQFDSKAAAKKMLLKNR